MRGSAIKKLSKIFPSVESDKERKRMWNSLNWKEKTELTKKFREAIDDNVLDETESVEEVVESMKEMIKNV